MTTPFKPMEPDVFGHFQQVRRAIGDTSLLDLLNELGCLVSRSRAALFAVKAMLLEQLRTDTDVHALNLAEMAYEALCGRFEELEVEIEQYDVSAYQQIRMLVEVANALAVAAASGSSKTDLDAQVKILWAHKAAGVATEEHCQAFVDSVAARGLEVIMVTMLVDEAPHVVDADEAEDLIRRKVAKRIPAGAQEKAQASCDAAEEAEALPRAAGRSAGAKGSGAKRPRKAA